MCGLKKGIRAFGVLIWVLARRMWPEPVYIHITNSHAPPQQLRGLVLQRVERGVKGGRVGVEELREVIEARAVQLLALYIVIVSVW